jgi:quercetin dioxygenase-like cupin family protein
MSRVTRSCSIAVLGMLLSAMSAARADVDPKAVQVTAPADIKWVRNAAGTNETATLFGDPSKPGPYVMRIKWLPGNMSRPHTHATDRFFVVISGTWWVGSGTKFDPDSTVPAGPGSYVIHYANQPHYDGAKDAETVIQVWGIGPLTTESAEQRP